MVQDFIHLKLAETPLRRDLRLALNCCSPAIVELEMPTAIYLSSLDKPALRRRWTD